MGVSPQEIEAVPQAAVDAALRVFDWSKADGMEVMGRIRAMLAVARPHLDEAAENQRRVHEEAANPTADWIELADDPDTPRDPLADRPTLSTADVEAIGRDGIRLLTEQFHTIAQRFTRLDETVAKIADLRVAAIDYPAHWGRERTQAEHTHRERMARISADHEFQRGVAIGKAEGEAQAIDGQLVTSGPSDYEVWRDALLIASPIFAGGGDAETVLTIAETVIRPSLRNCGDIGAADEPMQLEREATRCLECRLLDGDHDPWCTKADRERSADQLDPNEDEHAAGEMALNTPHDEHREPDRD